MDLMFTIKFISKDDYFIVKIHRDSEYEESPAVRAKIVEAFKNFIYLIGAKRSHAISYLKTLDHFAMQKYKF